VLKVNANEGFSPNHSTYNKVELTSFVGCVDVDANQAEVQKTFAVTMVCFSDPFCLQFL